jgi:hopanoid biosynthesis associated RND transporter like protein HpnN
VIKEILRHCDGIFVRIVNFCARRALYVICIAILLTTGIVNYTAKNFKINSDTSDMLSPELDFRQEYSSYKKAMPAFGDSLVIVVEAPNPDQAEDAARELAERLRSTAGIKGPVKYLAADPFFAKNGLLYLKSAELEELANRLADAQPLLASLSADPSLRGLFDVLSLALKEAERGGKATARIGVVLDKLAAVAEARAKGQSDELSWQRLISGKPVDRSVTREFIRVGIELDFSSLGPAQKSMNIVRKVAEVAGLTPEHGIRVRLTGGNAMATEELGSVSVGAKKAGWISLVLVALLLFVGLGSSRLVLATLLTLVTGLIWTAGFAIAVVGHLNLISVAFAVLFIGLGVDFGIHFGLRFREEIVAGRPQALALENATKDLGGALTLCATAAAIGFFSFIPTNYVGLAELGLISGVGMFVALIANFTLLPALLSLMPFKVKLRPSLIQIVMPDFVIKKFGSSLAMGALVLGFVCVFFVPLAQFDFNPLHLKDPTTESVQTAMDLMADPKISSETISILVKEKETAAKLAKELSTLPDVSRVVWLKNFIPDNQQEKATTIQNIAFTMLSVFDPSNQKEPPGKSDLVEATTQFRHKLIATANDQKADGALARSAGRLAVALAPFIQKESGNGTSITDLQNALLDRLDGRLARLKQSLDPTPFVASEIPIALRGRYVASDGRFRVEVYPKENINNNEAMKRFTIAVRKQTPGVTGSPVVLVESGRIVLEAIAQASLTALVSICILLIIVLRNLWDTVLVLLPLVLAAVWTVAASVIFNIPFNYANVIVVPLLLGLGVASGIHLVMRSRLGLTESELLRTTTPRAVVFSALTTIGSFGSLAVSSHRGTASMGELLMVAIGFTLLSTLVILPALMGWLEKRGFRQTRQT